MDPIVPRPLREGDTVAFIAPSARLIDTMPDVVARGSKVFIDKGYKVRTIFNKDKGLQDSITNRISEIREAFSDKSIAAIICTIGGTTFTELIPTLLDDKDLHETIRANPKIVVGYSDISGFHWFLRSVTGLRTFYGPGVIAELGEASSLSDERSPRAFCMRHLLRAIASTDPLGEISRSPTYAPEFPRVFEDPKSTEVSKLVPAPSWQWLRRGRGKGRLFGGCLSVIVRLQGVQVITPDWKGKIVFVENAPGDDNNGPPLYRVQAALADLIAGGVFDDAAGLVVGRAQGYDTDQQRSEFARVITDLFCEGRLAKTRFPILFNVDIGHTTPMVTLPMDAMALMDSERDSFAVVESGVA